MPARAAMLRLAAVAALVCLSAQEPVCAAVHAAAGGKAASSSVPAVTPGFLPLPAPRPAPRNTTLSTTTTIQYSPASPVAWPARVMLTATVLDQNSTPVTQGTVLFCTDKTLCTANIASGPIGIVGTAQLNGTGTASLRAFLAPATYSGLVAIFLGANGDRASVSNPPAVPLAVSGQTPTSTALVSAGVPGNYTLTATVTGGGYLPPSGTLLFLDTSNANATVAGAALDTLLAVPQFLLASSPVTATGPHSIAIADFNGDGYPDIAEVNYGDITNGNGNTLSILLGNGTGVYTVNSTITIGSGASAVATGDFNNDGIPDLAVTSYNSGCVTILLGHGDGNFTIVANTVPTGNGPWSIIAGDVNNDGNLDLVVTNSDDTVSSGDLNGDISVLLGDGTGNFTLASRPTVGETPVEAALGDFNGDGNLDIAVANQDSNSITLLYGDGTGNYPTSATLAAGNEPVTVTVSDFNLDGKLDLAAGNYVDNTASVWLGDGAGGFTPALHSPFAAGEGPQTVRAGDFNNDGLPDLVVSDGNGNNFTILLGDGTGNFSPLSSPAPTGTGPFYFAAADLNGDGMTDLVSANLGAASLSVLLGQWSGNATANNVSIAATGTQQVEADYPGDTTRQSSLSGTVALLGSDSTTGTTLLGSPAGGVDAGQSVQLTAQVLPSTYYSFTATGSVRFYDGSTLLGAVSISSGVAMLITPALSAGQHTYAAVYSGDTYFSGSTSPPLVYDVAAPSISLSVFPASFTVQQGAATGDSTLTLTTVGYNGNYTLQCSGGVPQYSLCEFSPAALVVAGDGTHTVSFQLQTSGYNWTLPKGAALPWLPAIFCAAMAALAHRRLRRSGHPLPRLLVLLLLAGIFFSTAGCTTIQPEFTPAGTYTVDVTVSGNGFSQTVPYTITVVPLQ